MICRGTVPTTSKDEAIAVVGRAGGLPRQPPHRHRALHVTLLRFRHQLHGQARCVPCHQVAFKMHSSRQGHGAHGILNISMLPSVTLHATDPIPLQDKYIADILFKRATTAQARINQDMQRLKSEGGREPSCWIYGLENIEARKCECFHIFNSEYIH